MGRIAILGAGGHGEDLADIAEACGIAYEFYDDGRGSLPTCSSLEHGQPYVVGVNDPKVRRRLAVGSTPTRLIHPTAVVSPSASLAGGCVVGALTVIGPSVTAGPHTHIGAGCFLTRTRLGAFVTIGPNVAVGGDCTIDSEAFVGIGANIANLITIGRGARVGAGAVVIRDVAAGTTVAGVPARDIHQREGQAA